MSAAEKDKDLLLKYLGQVTESENAIRNTARTTMNYYSTLLLSLTGGIIIVSKDLKDVFLYGLSFILGGLILGAVAVIAYLHYRSDYRRQIESMTIGAKLEDILGFTDTERYKTSYWDQEAILPPLYLKTRRSHPDSAGFVDTFLKGTDMTYVRLYYTMYGLIGIAYIVVGVNKLLP